MDLSCVSQSLGEHSLPPLNECLLPLLSKLIGFTIIATSTVCKVPQIYLILKSKSIKGLSIPSFELEVIGFTISLAYCIFKQLAFTAYGELVFLVLQSVIQVGLMYYYSPSGIGTWLKSGLYFAITPVLMAGHLDPMLFEALYASQHVIFLVAKIPQIRENYQNKSTGQLSFVTNFLNFGGVFGESLCVYIRAHAHAHTHTHTQFPPTTHTHTHTHTHTKSHKKKENLSPGLVYNVILMALVSKFCSTALYKFSRACAAKQTLISKSVIIGCLLGIVTNGIIMWQFLIYRGSQPKKMQKVA